MRLWSLHPCYLDSKGLVALWREALLAKTVLQGKTRGYRHHPQLSRFEQHGDPAAAINDYLYYVWQEAEQRRYRFDQNKLLGLQGCASITLPTGQLDYEWAHFLSKLKGRDPQRFLASQTVIRPKQHPIFELVSGGIAEWEKLS